MAKSRKCNNRELASNVLLNVCHAGMAQYVCFGMAVLDVSSPEPQMLVRANLLAFASNLKRLLSKSLLAHFMFLVRGGHSLPLACVGRFYAHTTRCEQCIDAVHIRSLCVCSCVCMYLKVFCHFFCIPHCVHLGVCLLAVHPCCIKVCVFLFLLTASYFVTVWSRASICTCVSVLGEQKTCTSCNSVATCYNDFWNALKRTLHPKGTQPLSHFAFQPLGHQTFLNLRRVSMEIATQICLCFCSTSSSL